MSHYWKLSGDWQMQASLLYYDYPSNTRADVYNRVEAGVNWIYRDILTFGLSADSLTQGSDQQPRGAADIDVHWPLLWHLSLSAGAGVAQSLVSPYSSYEYGHVNIYDYGHAGLMWADGPWRVEVDRIMIDASVRRQGGDRVPASWVGTISRSF